MCIRDRQVDAGGDASQADRPVVDGIHRSHDGQEHLRRADAVSYTHLRAHETVLDLVCRLLLEKKKEAHVTCDL